MPVHLSVDATAAQDSLSLRYTVTNSSDTAIYLVNRLIRWTEAGMFADSDVAYTEVASGTLQLIQAYLPVPDDIDVESPMVPYLTPLAVGATFSHTLEMSLPLQPLHPYYSDELLSEAVVEYDRAQFVLGWVEQTAINAETFTGQNGERMIAADWQPVQQHQHLLTTDIPLRIPAQIKARR